MENFCEKNKAVIATTFIRWLKEEKVYGIFCKTYRRARWSNANTSNPTLTLDNCYSIYEGITKTHNFGESKAKSIIDHLICYRDSEKKGCLTERQLIRLCGRWMIFFKKFKRLL